MDFRAGFLFPFFYFFSVNCVRPFAIADVKNEDRIILTWSA